MAGNILSDIAHTLSRLLAVAPYTVLTAVRSSQVLTVAHLGAGEFFGEAGGFPLCVLCAVLLWYPGTL
jgi:hypothetical protein